MKKRLTLILAIVLIVSTCLTPAGLIHAAAKEPKLNVQRLSLTVDSSYFLRVYNTTKKQKIFFSSSNEDVVALEDGSNEKMISLNALSVGSSVITVTVKKKKKVIKTLKCKVKVFPSAVSIKFTKRQVSVSVDKKKRLETFIKPNTSIEQPIFESSNPDIATVNARGVITGVSPGTVTIVATLLSNSAYASCTVTVLPE